MRFSVWLDAGQPWAAVLSVAQHAAATGWHGVWIADDLFAGADGEGEVLECWSTVAAIAATVERVRVGALVSAAGYRHPAVLAKAVTTIDHISGGRAVLGLGVGSEEDQHRAYGIDFPETRERLGRLEEACQVIKKLTTGSRATFAGNHYRLTDAPFAPEPVQSPLPLLVGGRGEKVTMRIAARWADEWNAWTTPEVFVHKAAVLARHCDDIGRDPTTIARSTQALLFLGDDPAWLRDRRAEMAGRRASMIGMPAELVEIVGRYADAGVDELIVPDFSLGLGQAKLDTYDRFFTEVAAPFHD